MNSKSAKLKRKNSKKTRSKKSYRRRTRCLKPRKYKSKRKLRIMKGGDYVLSENDINEIKNAASNITSDYPEEMMSEALLKEKDPDTQRLLSDYTRNVNTAVNRLVNDILSKNNALDKEEVRRSIAKQIYDFLTPPNLIN